MAPSLPVEVGAAIAYAAPTGSAEQGSRLGDTSWGLVSVDADVSYRFTSRLAAVLWARYGANIPTLCTSTGDCIASLGRDVALAARARFFLPSIGPMAPRIDAGIGFEWWTTKLTERDAVSRRKNAGPIALSLEAAAPFRLGERWTLGPVVAAQIGTFTTSALETGAFSHEGAVAGQTVHAWLSFGLRTAVRF